MANTPTVRKQQSKPTASGAGRPTARLRPQNRKLLKWLDSWLATPDNRGEERAVTSDESRQRESEVRGPASEVGTSVTSDENAEGRDWDWRLQIQGSRMAR
jgi:hypothetical protein